MKSLKTLVVVLLVLCSAAAAASVRTPLWQKIRSATHQGLPKTALQSLPALIASAERDHAWGEAARAVVLRVALEARIQGNKPEEKITRLQAEYAKAPAPMRPVLDAVLAEWYWQYFQENRWRFMQRSETTTSPGDDFTAWDLKRIYAEIDAHFSRALADTTSLRATRIEEWSDLLQGGNSPDAYRPTLYDFVAFEALRFYESAEQAGARPEAAFVLRADGPVLDDADAFVHWSIATSDTTAPAYEAARLYQVLLGWHARRGDVEALVDADLWRIAFAKNNAVGAGKDERVRRAYEQLANRWAGHELSSRALSGWASLLNEQGDLVGAHDVAVRGEARFPGSIGSNQCFNLRRAIEDRELTVTTEGVWNAAGPMLDVRYRNLKGVHFRLVPWDFAAMSERPAGPWQLETHDLDRALAATPVRAWSEPLAGTPDHKVTVAHLHGPADVKPGTYVLLYSGRADFSATDNVVGASVIWVSDLAVVIRGTAGTVDGLVLDAASGEPVAGAEVRPYAGDYGHIRAAATLRTDAAGHFTWASTRPVEWLVASAGPRRLGVALQLYTGVPGPQEPYARTMFFTDRAIYRPGQPIHFKGICMSVDPEKDGYHTIAAQAVTVVFQDANGKEVARRALKSNDYGAFDGEFEAPRDRALGAMSLRVDGGPDGSTGFRVEEYKRPKFFVELDAPKRPAALDSLVVVTGRATAYTGAAVDGATAKWRVVRAVRYPTWWSWRYWWWGAPASAPQEIAHGESAVNSEGRFEVRFVAHPDSAVDASQEPTFAFSVSADVTEPAGETRSAARQVVVGYTVLAASVTANDWLVASQPVELRLFTSTLDGVPQAARGTVVVRRLREPERVERAALDSGEGDRGWAPRDDKHAPEPNPLDPRTWPLGDVVATKPFVTDTLGVQTVAFTLPAGLYRATLETHDRNGRTVIAEQPLQVVDLAATRTTTKLPDVFRVEKTSVEVGQEFVAVWGTGYEKGRAYVEIVSRGRTVLAYWTPAGATQAVIRYRVPAEMRGGFQVHVTMVRENRAYTHDVAVDVPWTDHTLALRWEHFTSKLRPGQHETWSAVVTGPDATRHAAEMVATLYDASLDAYAGLWWSSSFGVFRHDYAWSMTRFGSTVSTLYPVRGSWKREYRDASLDYRSFPYGLLWGQYDESLVPLALTRPRPGVAASKKVRVRVSGGTSMGDGASLGGGRTAMTMRAEGVNAMSAPAPAAMMMKAGIAADAAEKGKLALRGGRQDELEVTSSTTRLADSPGVAGAAATPSLDQVTARHNLQETAFFFPHLIANAQGEVRMEFTMPDAVTRWKFLGFAHDRDLRSGLLTGEAVTTRELMVQPNAPRFLRERDTLEFTVKVTNLSDLPQAGRVRLTFADAATGDAVTPLLGVVQPEQPFAVPARQSRVYAWTLRVPDDLGPVTYTAVAASAGFSDGEDGALPVVSRSILVTESLPLPIRGAGTKTFDMDRLVHSGGSDRIRSQSLTVQMVSNPSWYAVMALPYLMEFPYECSEQTFNRLYANRLAQHIVTSDPKIRNVFERWRGTPALNSPLEKNADLRAATLLETPWVRQAEAESQARRNVGVLFDEPRLASESDAAYQKLAAMQLPDGSWPWFPGGRGSDYLTLYITTGFGRLRHLGVNAPMDPAIRALRRLDTWSDERYRDILRHGVKDANHLSPEIALYLYGRSFFLADEPFAPRYTEARDYWLAQARKYWLQLDSRQSQGQLALALNRFGDAPTAKAILKSVREHAVESEEMGMFWRDEEHSWWWYRAPIETQATLIEAFDEVAKDSVAVEGCRVWLLKQKQTQDWKTTKATADAVYALLLRGRDVLASDKLVEVTLGGQALAPASVEPGTGFVEQRFKGAQIKPEMGHVVTRKTDPGVAWGSLHWQYLADVNDVTPWTGTPLTLHKRLYVRRATASGPVLEPVTGAVHVGDELVVRLELRVDRDMEYVHLKDGRGSGTEPVNVLSGYRSQDGLWYYEETRDTATNFFIDYLAKGTYVFEYSVRVQHRGRYPSGIAEIQSMYAPEFNSHSESVRIVAE